MESPVTIVKSAINPMSIVKGLIGLVIGFAVLDLLGWTSAVIYPITTAKAKFATSAATT